MHHVCVSVSVLACDGDIRGALTEKVIDIYVLPPTSRICLMSQIQIGLGKQALLTLGTCPRKTHSVHTTHHRPTLGSHCLFDVEPHKLTCKPNQFVFVQTVRN